MLAVRYFFSRPKNQIGAFDFRTGLARQPLPGRTSRLIATKMDSSFVVLSAGPCYHIWEAQGSRVRYKEKLTHFSC